MNDLVLIQQDRPSVQIQDTATITVLDSPDIVRVENNANIIVSNSDLPVFVKYSTQKGEDGRTPTNEEITDLVTPEFIISKLTGQIKSTELYGDLASRIDKIAVLENSVYNLNNAVSLAVTETGVAAILEDYATTADTTIAIAQTRDGLLSTIGNNIATSLSEYTTTANLDGAIATKVDTLIAGTGNSLGDLSAALEIEQKVRAQTIAPLWLVNKEYQKGEAVLYNKIIYQCVTLAGANIGLVPSSNPTHWKLVEANLYAQYSIKTDVNGNVAGFGLANDGVTSDFTVLADRFSISAAADTTNTNVPFIVTGGKVYINSALIAAASITEAEIENGAITNAKIKDVIQSTVYTPGAGGTGWMIDKAGTIRGQGIIVEDGSITTAKIANAAIGTAQIGNAQVDTLQLKGDAVTIPNGATQIGVIHPAYNESTYDRISCQVDLDTSYDDGAGGTIIAPVLITFSVSVYQVSYTSGSGLVVSLYEGGNLLWESNAKSFPVPVGTVVTSCLKYTPTVSGSRTYYLKVNAGAYSDISKGSILVIGSKR